MAQVNSEPGLNQAAANKVVTSGRAQPGSVAAETFANATTVPYTQIEPGRHSEDKRS